MKAEDLMVGDWYWWEAEGKKYPLQVTKDTFKLSDEDISNFQPIPLTTEILEKNGFRDTSFECHKKQHYIVDTSEHILHYHTNLNSFSIYKKEEVLCCFLQNNVQYVHELQHALKLCGINKEITL